jgi:hypothetical protein
MNELDETQLFSMGYSVWPWEKAGHLPNYFMRAHGKIYVNKFERKLFRRFKKTERTVLIGRLNHLLACNVSINVFSYLTQRILDIDSFLRDF